MSRFIDEAIITISSGKGGPGSVSFRREKFEPMGGPNGGDGGKGGDVYLVADTNLGTLMDLRYKRKYAAGNGMAGSGSNKNGSDGNDLEIPLPIGSVVTDLESGQILFEIKSPSDRFLIAKGGLGGKGNTHFKSSTHQAPRFAQPGLEGQTLHVKVELKLLADVGIVGYPNAGKSTLISKISAARPKIAAYAFTTLVPNLGVVRLGHEKTSPTFVVADVPGLIEGSSLGRGKGTRFLKHLDHTSLLIHMIDGAKLLKEFGEDAGQLAKAIVRDKEIIDTELYTFSERLAARPQILALNKCDLFSEKTLEAIKKKLSRKKDYKNIHFISAAAHLNLDTLLKEVAQKLYVLKGLPVKGLHKTKALTPDEATLR
jgi:GTP-binding protein